MADALISFVLEQLASYGQSEITLVMDTHQQVTNLTRNLELVQAVLADADRKQVKSEAVRLWLDNLKQVVYDADDVLDEWHTRDVISRLQSEVDVASGSRKKVLSYLLSPCFCFKNVTVRYDIGHQIKDINTRLDVIAKQRKDYGLTFVKVNQTWDESRLTSSVVDASKIHGRDKSKGDIISRIFAESSSQGTDLRVISIVGAGGLGKTTLVGLIFNDEKVVEVFKTKMWVCVSDPFNRVRVAKAIIKEAGGDVSDSTEWQEVHKCLWMAQGFFGYEGNDLEKNGEDHFRILVVRSFFQDFKKDSSGNITHCKMHDLVHDFAMYLSQNESCFLQDGDVIPESDQIRYLFAYEVEIAHISKSKSLRTLFLGSRYPVPIELFDKLMCLRTLDMSYCALEVLPDEVEKLVHLRYLDLSRTELLELPETVCNLYNLQFLGLEYCQSLCKLPEKIGKLSNLRHLEIKGTKALSHFPKSFATLSFLRSLCKFIVSGGDRGCKIGDLQLFNDLRGVLELKGLSKVTDEKDAIQAELKMKRHLRELIFDFKEEECGARTGMKNVLEKLEPHEDLEILEICDYSDSHFPGWVQSSLSLASVVEISVFRCRECTELPAFGKLVSLKTLVIKEMGSVIRIGQEFYGFDVHQMTAFPKLESLVIEDMKKLEEWEVPISKDRKIMPLLSQLRLNKFPMLRALPCLGSLESLEELSMWNMNSVKYIGNEFYGVEGDSSLGVGLIAFPKLKTVAVNTFYELEEWEIPISGDRKIMPLLSQLELLWCGKLRELPRVWRMEALEVLVLEGLDSVKGVGVEFVGDKEGSLQDGVTFSKLKELNISLMAELEEWGVPLITPCLKKIGLYYFPKLKRLPTFQGCVETLESLQIVNMESWEGQEKFVINDSERGDSRVLRSLTIRFCSKLCVVPGHLFSPSLEELELQGKVGAIYDDDGSFPALCSITELTLCILPYSSLPKGFHQLKALQRLRFDDCETLDFDLKELGELTMLQHLEITDCPHLKKRFKGDDWRTILAHLPTINIDWVNIRTKRSTIFESIT